MGPADVKALAASLRRGWWVLGILAVGLGLWLVVRSPHARRASANTDTIRLTYSQLYEAAWRQDQGRGDVVMTATLFAPPLLEDLAADSGRSQIEDLMLQALKQATASDIPIFITTDSVGGAVADNDLKNSLSLSSGSTSYGLTSWTPLYTPSRVVNTNDHTVAQSGVAIFHASTAVNWRTMKNLTLVSHNLGGQASRQFVWADPGLLLAVQP